MATVGNGIVDPVNGYTLFSFKIIIILFCFPAKQKDY